MSDTTTDVATLEALLDRVKQATGPDLRLDRDLVKALNKEWTPWNYIPTYTGCVSAALALVEKALPATDSRPADSPTSSGWKIGLYRGTTPSCDKYAVWECMIRKHGGKEIWHHAPTAPLAILAALLQAQIAIVSGVTEEPRT